METIIKIAAAFLAIGLAIIIYRSVRLGLLMADKIDDEITHLDKCECGPDLDINCPLHGLYRGSYFAGGLIEPGEEIPAILPRGETIVSRRTFDRYKEAARHMAAHGQPLAIETNYPLVTSPEHAEAMRERFRQRHPNMAEAWEREIGYAYGLDDGDPLPAAMLAPPNIGGADHPAYRGPNYVAPEEIAAEMKGLAYWDRISQHIYDEWLADQVAAGKIVFPKESGQ